MGLVKHAESDAWLALGLSFHLNVLPMTRQLTSLCGFLWSRTLQVEPDPMPYALYPFLAHPINEPASQIFSSDLRGVY